MLLAVAHHIYSDLRVKTPSVDEDSHVAERMYGMYVMYVRVVHVCLRWDRVVCRFCLRQRDKKIACGVCVLVLFVEG